MRVSRKTSIKGELPKKGVWGGFKSGLGKKEGEGVFEGELRLQCALWQNFSGL